MELPQGSRPDPSRATDIAGLVELLGLLRLWAGNPSLRTLARKVGPLLRPPRPMSHTTLADTFGTGRRRLDLDVVTAIVRALGLDEAEAARWRDACIAVHAGARTGGPAGVFRQLPADLGTFTGRTAAMKELLDAASTPGVDGPTTVVICAIEGMAGVGKTQLAVHAAHELVRTGRFTDVQLYANLRGFDADRPPVDSASVLDAFLRQLGVPGPQIPNGLDARSVMFRDRMHGRDALILLDNAGSGVQIRDLIPASPTCLVLVTSRRTLGGLEGASLLLLDVFDEAEALELLSRIAGATRVAAEPEAARRIVEACGYLPLAVALAASRLRSRPAWRLDHLADRLARGQANGGHGRNLNAVFDLSYRGLPPPARRLFRLLGLHPGTDFTAPTAAALARLPLAEAEDWLELLQDEHLVQQKTHGRYEFHNLLHAYAAERAQAQEKPQERREATEQLLNWYLVTADAAASIFRPDRKRQGLEGLPSSATALAFADHVEALDWCEQERANIVAAVRRAAELHSPAAWLLPAAMFHLYGLNSHIDDLAETHEIGLRAAQDASEPRARFRMLTGLWAARVRQERIPEAVDIAEQALHAAQEADDQVMVASGIALYATSLTYVGRNDEAISWFEKAIPMIRAGGDPAALVAATNNLGMVLRKLGRYEEALSRLQEALDTGRVHAIPLFDADILDSIGQVWLSMDEAAKAAESFQQSVAASGRLRATLTMAPSLDRLGDALTRAGREPEAVTAWRQALSIFDEHGDARADAVRIKLHAGAGSLNSVDAAVAGEGRGGSGTTGA